MSGSAQVSSIEALEEFRAKLIVYVSQMQPTIDEVGSELVRMYHWLDVTQRQHWEGQLRVRRRKLEEAQAELFNAKMSSLQTSSTLHGMAVQKARRAVEEAEQKLGAIKKWSRDLENISDPLLKQVGQLQSYLSNEMGNATACLNQAILALAAYRDVAPAGPTSNPLPSPEIPPHES